MPENWPDSRRPDSRHPDADRAAQTHPAPPTDVIVVGAGPVGLTVALALGEAGKSVIVLERRPAVRATSRAIGITPASLEILQRYGMADELIAAGLPVRRAIIHGDRQTVATPGFDAIRSPFPFILTLPQRHTEEILAARIERLPTVHIVRGAAVTAIEEHDHGVTAWYSADETSSVTGRFLCGCDGKRSTVRNYVTDTWHGRRLRETFAMADITDDTDLEDAAHLYFTREGSVESFPLPGGIRRWIVETDQWYADAPAGLVQELVARRTGTELSCSPEHWRSSFHTERFRVTHWHRGRTILAGDAAHVMPPIGGQGMNVGLGDAEHLADLLIESLDDSSHFAEGAARYTSRRRRAFDVAARRSILGMKIGAARGVIRSHLRSWAIRNTVRGAAANWVMEHFAMIASPFRRSPG
ncbi:MAG TPA: NAD(P)/FAD-dependent oxidoreductase [Alkalispirochaeta sp.]|nr:NAD(P)/FAD-dependent oxidoreductase [Alkalispirochaeta sp.]